MNDDRSNGRVAATIGNVQHPVGDVAAAVEFYSAALGLKQKFIDGSRYAALDGGGATLALASAGEDITEGRGAASFKVCDIDEAVASCRAAGAVVLRGPEEGPHELRAVVEDPWGNVFVLYATRSVD